MPQMVRTDFTIEPVIDGQSPTVISLQVTALGSISLAVTRVDCWVADGVVQGVLGPTFSLLVELATAVAEEQLKQRLRWVMELSSPLNTPQGPWSGFLQMTQKCLPSRGALGQMHLSPNAHWGIIVVQEKKNKVLRYFLTSCPVQDTDRTLDTDETKASPVLSVPWTRPVSWTAWALQPVQEWAARSAEFAKLA